MPVIKKYFVRERKSKIKGRKKYRKRDKQRKNKSYN